MNSLLFYELVKYFDGNGKVKYFVCVCEKEKKAVLSHSFLYNDHIYVIAKYSNTCRLINETNHGLCDSKVTLFLTECITDKLPKTVCYSPFEIEVK